VHYVAGHSPSRTVFRNLLGEPTHRAPSRAIAFPRMNSETQRADEVSDARVQACCKRRHSTAVPRVHLSSIPDPYPDAMRPIPTAAEGVGLGFFHSRERSVARARLPRWLRSRGGRREGCARYLRPRYGSRENTTGKMYSTAKLINSLPYNFRLNYVKPFHHGK
jgi:hypothetical protein